MARLTLPIVVAITALAVSVSASAQDEQAPGPSTLDFRFDATQPSAPTGLRFQIEYRSPDGPDVKPPALDGLRLTAPQGTVFDPSAAPVCTATDEEFRLLGRMACPPETQIGHGTLVAITGVGPPVDPFETDVTVFNGTAGPIELVQEPATGLVFGTDRLTIEDSTLVAHPPAFPGGPPDLRTAVRSVDITFTDTAFVTTPGVCPDRGEWVAAALIEFADGTSQTAMSAQACQPTRPSAGSPPDTNGGPPATPPTPGAANVAPAALPVTGGTVPVSAGAVIAVAGVVAMVLRWLSHGTRLANRAARSDRTRPLRPNR